jgi:O-antigen/teichoic acid export membrane protein
VDREIIEARRSRPWQGHSAVGKTLGTQFAIQALSLVSGALVARALGVEDRGLLAALVLWSAIVANVGDLGGPAASAYLTARGHPLPALAGNALALSGVQAALLGVVGIPIMALGLHRYPDQLGLGIVLLLVYLPLNLVTRYLNAINQGLGDFGRFNAIRVTVQAAYVAGVAGLFVAGSISVVAVVVMVIVSNAVVATLALVQRFARTPLRPRVDWGLLHETSRYGPRAHIGSLTPVDSMQLDLAVVVLFLGARDAGLYAVAVSAAMVVRAQGTALGMVAFPTVAAAADGKARRAAAAGIFRVGLLLNVATAAVIALAAPWLVPAVFGEPFAPAVPIVQILMVGVVAASLRHVLGDVLRGFGQPTSATLAELASWIVAAACFAIFVPLLGAEGAAVSASLAYASALVVSLGFAARLGISRRELFVPRRADVSLLLRLPRVITRRGRIAVAEGPS